MQPLEEADGAALAILVRAGVEGRPPEPPRHVHAVFGVRVGIHCLPHCVVGSPGEWGDLKPFPQQAELRHRGAGVERQAGRCARPIQRLVVDPRGRQGVIERPRAQRLSRDGLTEALASLVHKQRRVARQAEIPLDVADAGLAPHAELHAVRGVPARLRRDLNDSVARPGSVQRRTCRSLHHLDALDVVRVEIREVAVDHDAVDDVEGVLAAALSVDHRRAAQQHRRLRPRPTTRRNDLRASHLPLELGQRVLRRHRHLRRVHVIQGEWRFGQLRPFLHAGNDDGLQQVDVVDQGEIDRLLAHGERELLAPGLEPNAARPQEQRLAPDTRARHGQHIAAVIRRIGGEAQLLDEDVRAHNGLTPIRDDAAFDHRVLGASGVRAGETQQRQHGHTEPEVTTCLGHGNTPSVVGERPGAPDGRQRAGGPGGGQGVAGTAAAEDGGQRA